MKHYIISEEELNKLKSIARSLHFANVCLFTGREETSRDVADQIKEVIDSSKELEISEIPNNLK